MDQDEVCKRLELEKEHLLLQETLGLNEVLEVIEEEGEEEEEEEQEEEEGEEEEEEEKEEEEEELEEEHERNNLSVPWDIMGHI